jgi:hypothetical protein
MLNEQLKIIILYEVVMGDLLNKLHHCVANLLFNALFSRANQKLPAMKIFLLSIILLASVAFLRQVILPIRMYIIKLTGEHKSYSLKYKKA